MAWRGGRARYAQTHSSDHHAVGLVIDLGSSGTIERDLSRAFSVVTGLASYMQMRPDEMIADKQCNGASCRSRTSPN